MTRGMPEPPDLSGRLLDRARRQILHENKTLSARVVELENELAAERVKSAKQKEEIAILREMLAMENY